MGATKCELYTEELVRLADLLKATAHPARLKALLIIARETDNDVTAAEIQKEIKLSQSTISQHLKQLRDVGLVKNKMVLKNNKACLSYRIDREAVEQVEKLIHYLFEKTDLKYDDRFETVQSFFSKLHKITNWNQCFES